MFLSETAYGVDRSGWTVGGGLEWMFAPGWSVFGEYNYMDFGRKDVDVRDGAGRGRSVPTSSDQARSRAGSGRRELQVQLGWPGRRQVLSLSTEFFPRPIKSPGIVRGFFCAESNRATDSDRAAVRRAGVIVSVNAKQGGIAG